MAGAISRLSEIDVVYVSHIDQDHIAGILQMMDDAVAWRVHDFQRASGNTRHPKPKAPRPPKVGAIWHNSFHDQIGRNAGEITDMLAATAAILSASTQRGLLETAEMHRNLATSVEEAVRLSRRISPEQLGVPLNPQYGGRLMLLDGRGPFSVGSLRFTLIGPAKRDLEVLRKEWNAWLRTHKERVRELRRRAQDDERSLDVDAADRVVRPLEIQAEELGNRGKVTAPNLASLMFLVEEGPTTVLLTGDGHGEDIVSGLERRQRLNGGHLHVSVLKVQHHGSEHNIDRAFCDRITADHYLFCGNGAHENPDARVVELIVRSRLDGAGPDRPFTLWFNSSSRVEGQQKHQEHMAAVERLVKQLQAGNSRVRSRFMPANRSSVEITL